MFPKDKFVAPFVGSVAKLSVPIPYKLSVNVGVFGSSESIVKTDNLEPFEVVEKLIEPDSVFPPPIAPGLNVVEKSAAAFPAKSIAETVKLFTPRFDNSKTVEALVQISTVAPSNTGTPSTETSIFLSGAV